MEIGGKILGSIDEAIRLRDKLVLVLSEDSLQSDWVEIEVKAALDEEHRRKKVVLFPIRLDHAVMDTDEAWARLLRRERHIGDFTQWTDPVAYQRAFERVLRDLQPGSRPPL